MIPTSSWPPGSMTARQTFRLPHAVRSRPPSGRRPSRGSASACPRGGHRCPSSSPSPGPPRSSRSPSAPSPSACLRPQAGSAQQRHPSRRARAQAPSPTPSPTTASPSPSAIRIDTSQWDTYESARYGFTIGHPADWEVVPATRDWTFDAEASADDWSPAEEAFVNRAGDGIRVSAWSGPDRFRHEGRMGRRRGLGPGVLRADRQQPVHRHRTIERCRSASSGWTVIRACSCRSRTMSRHSSPTSMARR